MSAEQHDRDQQRKHMHAHLRAAERKPEKREQHLKSAEHYAQGLGIALPVPQPPKGENLDITGLSKDAPDYIAKLREKLIANGGSFYFKHLSRRRFSCPSCLATVLLGQDCVGNVVEDWKVTCVPCAKRGDVVPA